MDDKRKFYLLSKEEFDKILYNLMNYNKNVTKIVDDLILLIDMSASYQAVREEELSPDSSTKINQSSSEGGAKDSIKINNNNSP